MLPRRIKIGTLRGVLCRRHYMNLLSRTSSFEAAFRRYLNMAYTWDLWGAASVIHGGCSDDGFEYFRRWLVLRGRDVYEDALADPDSLAQLNSQSGPDGIWEFEEIYYVVPQVFLKRRAARVMCAITQS